MTRRIEAGIGDIKVELGERYIDIIKVSDGESHVMIRYNLNDDGKTCTRTITPYFIDEDTNGERETRKITITNDVGKKMFYSKDDLLHIADSLNTEPHLKRYFKTLIIDDFDSLEEIFCLEDTSVYDYDEDIEEALDSDWED